MTLGISRAALRGQPTAVIADLVKVVQQGGNTNEKTFHRKTNLPPALLRQQKHKREKTLGPHQWPIMTYQCLIRMGPISTYQ